MLASLYIANAANQAIEHCIRTTITAYLLPSSRRTVAIAATHGVYSRQKTINTNAVIGVNISEILPASTLSVLTTLSLAINPVINAVEILQSLSPSGWNIGVNKLPSIASRLSAEFVTRFSRISNVCKNQIK